jgi:hypothetical protein
MGEEKNFFRKLLGGLDKEGEVQINVHGLGNILYKFCL